MINTLDETLYRLSLLNKEQEKIMYQSRGQVIDNGSDDPLVFTKQIYIEDKISVFKALQKQMESTNIQNKSSDTAIAGILEFVRNTKTEIMKALNDTQDDKSRKSIAISLEGIKKSIFSFSNEMSNGEYLFSGTNGTKAPFKWDKITNKVTYEGNGYLKRIAVEENSYRKRGISGFDLMMNTTSKATFGEKLKFTENERVIDNDGNEWKLDPLVPELVKYDEIGKTKEKIPLTEIIPSTTPKTYETTTKISKAKQVLKAKENIFDIFDSVINALNKVDSLGKPLSEKVSKEQLENGLEKINKAFDTINIAHSNLGARNKIFEVALEKVNFKLTHLDILYQKTMGSDVAKVAMELQALKSTYTLLYSTINTLNKSSLVNFIN